MRHQVHEFGRFYRSQVARRCAQTSVKAATAKTAQIIGFSNLITVMVILTMSFLQVVRREVAPLGTLGVIVANFLTKGLKLLVKRYGHEFLSRRPKESTRKAGDPGFPSSHTSNMTFISVYFALYLWLHLNWLPERSLLVALIPSSAMAAARICDKDHTLQQTIAGVLWGALLGLWWALIGPRLRGILEWAQPQPWALVVLCFVVGLPMFTKPLGLRLLPKGPTRRTRR